MSSLPLRLKILTNKRIDYYTRLGWYGQERKRALETEEQRTKRKAKSVSTLSQALKLLHNVN